MVHFQSKNHSKSMSGSNRSSLRMSHLLPQFSLPSVIRHLFFPRALPSIAEGNCKSIVLLQLQCFCVWCSLAVRPMGKLETTRLNHKTVYTRKESRHTKIIVSGGVVSSLIKRLNLYLQCHLLRILISGGMPQLALIGSLAATSNRNPHKS